MSKTITVRAEWRSHHTVEVPDDFEDTGSLSDFPEDVLESITTANAELIDWEVS